MAIDLFNEEKESFVLNNYKSFITLPNVPEVLKPLISIANNMWWCWNSDAVELFRRMDRELWESANHNPTAMLGMASQNLLDALAEDNSFISNMSRVENELNRYMTMKTWYKQNFSKYEKMNFVYFSTEFAIHESIPIYSGGLGVLSGDHLKSASDLGLPLTGIGLLYRFGYFRQHLNSEGFQQEDYNENHFTRMPLERVRNAKGEIITVSAAFPNNQTAHIRAWKLQIGRVPLYLLDTDFEENPREIRNITGELYGGDRDMRIRQEIVLGVGGVKLLKELDIEPDAVHINEGHSAFLIFERIRQYVEDKGLSVSDAMQMIRSGCIFTTHTPVPAGNEVFTSYLVDRYFEPLYKKIGMSRDDFLRLGAFPLPWGQQPPDFSMTILALRCANKANGVSRLHATVARDMWSQLYPNLPKKEIPITHITNGIHTNTWISYEFAGLFDRYLGAVWKDKPADHSIWKRIDSIPDTELWRSHERRKERLITFTRERLKQQLKRRGAPLKALSYADEVLDPEALTIGFARRFATYKRGDLIFRDLERLKKILTDKNCPVQMIIAGKAHPKDVFGKRIIQQIVNFANDAELRNKIIFIEDYDMNTAHYLVQGADIWLNNPIRPQEASGTSGMKAAVNGVLNLSVLDGWWCEGYNGENGWVIGSIENQSGDSAYQDDVDSRSIYEMLEREIIPLYFARNSNGLPRGWINKMKSSMRSLTPAFNTNRMVEEYVRKFYIPSALKHKKMAENNFENAKKSAWRHNNIAENWKNIKIISAEDNMEFEMQKGFKASITVRIYLGNIAPEDVSVQIYIGNIDTNKEITNPVISEMSILSKEGNDYIYNCQPLLNNIGHCAYAIRVLPKYDGEVQYMPEYIIWKGN